MRAILTIRGLFEFDNTIFEYFSVPDGMNKETAIEQIIINCSDLETTIPNPDAIKEAIKYWTIASFPQWERVYGALSAEFSPIENYDRYEQWNDTGSGSGSNTVTETSENKEKAFDSDSMVKNSETSGGSGTTSSSQSSASHTAHIHGNIGVVSASAMIAEVYEKLAPLNPYEFIVESFKKNFCVMIY